MALVLFFSSVDHFNECLPDSDKAGTYTHHSLMPSSPSMSCQQQRFFMCQLAYSRVSSYVMRKEIISVTTGMRMLFFSSIHKPYAILAISVLLLFIILPIALLVGYQFSCCQACLTKTRIKGRVLEEFMHSFNKYYKDGSGGTRDCRWFAAFYIAMRLCIYLLLFLPMTSLFYNFALVYSLLGALFVLVVEPYRDEYKRHNYLEPCVVLSLTLTLTATTGVNTSNVESRKYVKPLLMFTALVALLPIVYLCGVTVWWIYKRTPFGYRPVQQLTDSDQPDRLINSGNYKDSSTSINTVSD